MKWLFYIPELWNDYQHLLLDMPNDLDGIVGDCVVTITYSVLAVVRD